MPGVALDETVNCDNPLLQFYYQSNGQLKDVEVLSFVVRDIGANAERVASTPVTVGSDCGSGGHKLGTGRYAPVFTADSGASWAVGTHEIIWTYEVTAGDTPQVWRQRFEVLDKNVFPSGKGWDSYVESVELRKNSAFANCSISDIQNVGPSIVEQIHLYTGRIFGPHYIDTRYNSVNAGALVLQQPIIGIEKVIFVAGGPAEQLLPIDLDALLIYNRHLVSADGGGLTDWDDRDNPRIEFVTNQFPGDPIFQGHFLEGRLNVQVGGVFGYTEPDGTPIGRIPKRLQKAAAILTLRELLDPFGLDVGVSNPGRVKKAKTRDQMIEFAGSKDGQIGPLTGDRIVDDILIGYMRPPHYGAVTDIKRQRSSRRTETPEI